MQRTDLLGAINDMGKVLAFFGHWPQKKPTAWIRLKSALFIALQFAFVIASTVELTINFIDFRVLAQHLSAMIPMIVTATKLIFLKINKAHFFSLMELLDSEIFKSYPTSLDSYIKRNVNLCKTLFRFYGCVAGLAVTLYSLAPLIQGTVLPIPFQYDFGLWIYGVYLFQILAVFDTATNMVCIDSLAVCFMSSAVSQIDILKSRILLFAADNTHGMALIKSNINNCAYYHSEIIRLVGAIESVFSPILLCQFLGSIFTICNIGFQIVNFSPGSADFAYVIAFFSTMLFQLTLFCWFGNEISLKSVDIIDVCYETNWIEYDGAMKKSLFIMMERARRPLIITAGKFSKLSLASLVSILKASYSYFALMQRLYKDDE